MADRTLTESDPRSRGKKPPFDENVQSAPGTETEMRTKPDHGEESYVGYRRLVGKCALITGGDSGIGRAIAIAFAREGADVAISFLPEEQPDAEETSRWVRQAERQILQFPGNVADERYCRDLVDRTMESFGRLDVLVNNAALQIEHDKIQEFTSEDWDRTFRTNIYSMFHLSRAALPRMKTGGAIINTASVQAYQPRGNLLAYATTKGAIVTFTKALSDLALESGIRVNAVAPGPVWTPLIPASTPRERVSKFGGSSAMGRPAQPAEIAPAYVYLATADSTYVTGAVLDLTGGRKLP